MLPLFGCLRSDLSLHTLNNCDYLGLTLYSNKYDLTKCIIHKEKNQVKHTIVIFFPLFLYGIGQRVDTFFLFLLVAINVHVYNSHAWHFAGVGRWRNGRRDGLKIR